MSQKFERNFKALSNLQDTVPGLVKQHQSLILQWETGVGKTLPALRTAEKLGGKWLWVVSMNIQKDNVKAEMMKFNIRANIKFIHYASLHKETSSYTGIILDEVHKLTENYAVHFKKINTKYVLGLSASIPDDRKLLLQDLLQPAWSKVTMARAMQLGILPPIQIIGVELDINLDPNRYNVPMKRFKKVEDHPYEINQMSFSDYMMSSYIRHNFMVTGCTLKQRLQVIEREMEFWKELRRKDWEKKYEWTVETRSLPLGSERKRVLAEFKSRFMPIIEQRLKNKNFRYVVFNENIDQVESNEGVKIHSQQKSIDNEQAIKDFNEGKTNVLQVVKMLNEGINLVNIDAVVILALNSTSVQNIQRRGRSVRGDNPLVIVLYVKDTKDELNFKEFTKDYKEFTTIRPIIDFTK